MFWREWLPEEGEVSSEAATECIKTLREDGRKVEMSTAGATERIKIIGERRAEGRRVEDLNGARCFKKLRQRPSGAGRAKHSGVAVF